MVCPKCGNNVEDNASVCSQCGTPLDTPTVPEVVVPQDFKFQDDPTEQTFADNLPPELKLNLNNNGNDTEKKKKEFKLPIKAIKIVITIILVIIFVVMLYTTLKERGII